MVRPFLFLALIFAVSLFLASCSNDSSSEISGPTWPNQDLVDGQWVWLNPQPTGNQLLDVTFVDANTGWASGEGGELLHTTDGGLHWTKQVTGWDADIPMIRMVNAQYGWYISRSSSSRAWTSVIHMTTSGGTTWDYPTPAAYFSNCYVTDFCHDRRSNAWMVSSNGRIYYVTSDNQSELQLMNEAYSFTGVSFGDLQNVWAVGYQNVPRYQNTGFVLHTFDGGQSWVRQDSMNGQYPTSVFFLDDAHGWLTTSDAEVWRTVDGGTNWDSIYTEGYYSNFDRIQFTDLQHGWIRGRSDYESYVYWKTSDGGASWTSGGQNVRGVWFTDAMTGWTVGSSGQIQHTEDGGTYWAAQTRLITSTYLWDVHFSDSLSGITVGNAATILRTTDGGISWGNIQCDAGTDVELHAIASSSQNDLWIAGGAYSTAVILHSADGGLSWIERNFSGMSRLTDIEFTSPSTGWAVGERGLILRTIDAGANWTLQSSGVSGDLRGITFGDALSGWISGGPYDDYGSNAVLLTTHDGGATWSPEVFGGTRALIDVFALDATHLWATGWYGVLLHSSDGGQNWIVQNSATQNTLWKVQFLNPSVGWAVGENGTLRSTNDGGAHWITNLSGSGNHFLGFCAIDARNAWAVGQDGTIMRFVPYEIAVP
jgi:photosystem II stability/assembly factor-like uncharacterized protein